MGRYKSYLIDVQKKDAYFFDVFPLRDHGLFGMVKSIIVFVPQEGPTLILLMGPAGVISALQIITRRPVSLFLNSHWLTSIGTH